MNENEKSTIEIVMLLIQFHLWQKINDSEEFHKEIFLERL